MASLAVTTETNGGGLRRNSHVNANLNKAVLVMYIDCCAMGYYYEYIPIFTSLMIPECVLCT